MKQQILLLLFIPLCFLHSQKNSNTYTSIENNYKISKSEKANEYYDEATFLSLTASELEINGKKEDAIKIYKKAIDRFKKALLIDSLFTDALDNMALCYRRINEVDNAIFYYKKSLKIMPNNRMALNNLGTAYIAKGDFNNAIETYTSLLSVVEPNDKESAASRNFYKAEPYYGLAQTYFKMENYEKSKEYSFLASEIWKQNDLIEYSQDALYIYAFSEYFMGNEKKATDILIELANNGHQGSKDVLAYPE